MLRKRRPKLREFFHDILRLFGIDPRYEEDVIDECLDRLCKSVRDDSEIRRIIASTAPAAFRRWRRYTPARTPTRIVLSFYGSCSVNRTIRGFEAVGCPLVVPENYSAVTIVELEATAPVEFAFRRLGLPDPSGGYVMDYVTRTSYSMVTSISIAMSLGPGIYLFEVSGRGIDSTIQLDVHSCVY